MQSDVVDSVYARSTLTPRNLATLPPGACPAEPLHSWTCYELASSNRNAVYSQQIDGPKMTPFFMLFWPLLRNRFVSPLRNATAW